MDGYPHKKQSSLPPQYGFALNQHFCFHLNSGTDRRRRCSDTWRPWSSRFSLKSKSPGSSCVSARSSLCCCKISKKFAVTIKAKVSRSKGLVMHPCSGILPTLYESGNKGCNATQNLITFSWDTSHPLFPDQTFFDLPTSIFNHFHNKIVSAQRNT